MHLKRLNPRFTIAPLPIALLVIAVLPVSLLACGGDDVDGNTKMDSSMPRLPGTGDDWDVRVVASGDVGLHLQMAMTSQGPIFAYYDNTPTEGETCTEVGDAAPTKTFYGLHAARAEGTGFTAEKVDDILVVGEPPGLGLTAQGNSTWLATLGGEPVVFADIVGFCGGNDAVVYESSGASWQAQTAVTSSDEAQTGEAASDFGEVVGYWPGLASASDGTLALAYKDIHSGSAQRDDTRRSDLEIAVRRGGNWSAYPVDAGRGAGDFNRVAIGEDNALYVLYSVREESSGARGVWVARSQDAAATWETVRIASNSTLQGPDLALDPSSGEPVAAYYDTNLRLLRVLRYDGAGAFTDAASWKAETVGDGRFDEGHDPSLAFDAEGRLAVAYRRCVASTASSTACNPQDDAVIFASSADDWTPQVVDEGEDNAQCGLYPALAFDRLGAPRVGYACQTSNAGRLELEVRYAAGEAP